MRAMLMFAAKGGVVLFLMLLILIPLSMVRDTIREREGYRRQAVASVEQSYAGPQVFTGPVLLVPYTDHWETEDSDRHGNRIVVRHSRDEHWLAFPEQSVLGGTLGTSERRLGLFRVRIYEFDARLQARFAAQALPQPPAGVSRSWGRPRLGISLSDVRGLLGTPQLRVDGRAQRILQGNGWVARASEPAIADGAEAAVSARREGGVHVLLPAVAEGRIPAMQVELAAVVGGTETLAVAPLADSNRIEIASAWPHPSFVGGRFLPRQPRSDAAGFRADWDISALAAGTQGQYRGGQPLDDLDALRVSLIDPVDVYTLADRASKYALLFVLLTFAGFLMLELLRRLRIHPLQYLLVGLALSIFFLLLLSLSEHIEFAWSYLAASIACIGLLAWYLAAVLGGAKPALVFASLLGLLYAALYGLLVSEDNALVLGSGLLFAILAAIMLGTRRVNWYAVAQQDPQPANGSG